MRPFILALFTLLATTIAADPRSPMANRHKLVRHQITQLFELRDNPIPPLTESINPFSRDRTPPAAPAGAENTEIMPEPPTIAATDERILAEMIKTLRINGVVTFENRVLIIINQTPIPAGGVAVVDFQGMPRLLRVERIDVGEVTLSFGSAGAIVTF